MNRYETMYDNIKELQNELEEQAKNGDDWDYRGKVALGATYTLQDYLADRIASLGETPEGIQ